jgi:MFS family permease
MRPIKMGSNDSTKGIYILFFGNLLFGFAYGLYGYVFPNYLKSLGATYPEIGLTASLFALTQCLSYIPGGYLSDSGHRRKLVIASWLIPGLAPILYLWAELNTSWSIAVLGFVLFGLGWIGVPATWSYTREAVPKKKRGLVFGVLISSGTIGLIPAPLIGGWIIEQYGFMTLFIVALFLYTLATLLVLPIPRLHGDRSVPSGTPNHSEGLVKLENHKNRTHPSSMVPLLLVLSSGCAFVGISSISSSFMPLYLAGVYGFDYFTILFMFMVQSISMTFFGPLIGRISDKYSLARKFSVITIPILVYFSAFALLISSSSALWVPLVYILLGSSAAFYTILYSVAAELSPSKKVGRTYGFIGAPIAGAAATTPYLGGLLFNTSMQLPFIVALQLSPFVFIMLYVTYRKLKYKVHS